VWPPLCLETFQLPAALESRQRPLQPRPEVVDVVVLSGVLLDGERVLVAVERRAEAERVQVARFLVDPILGCARVDDERVLAVAVLNLTHAVCGSQRQLCLVHVLVYFPVKPIAALPEEILGESVFDKSVVDVGVLEQFNGRIDSVGCVAFLHQHDCVKRHEVVGEIDHSISDGNT